MYNSDTSTPSKKLVTKKTSSKIKPTPKPVSEMNVNDFKTVNPSKPSKPVQAPSAKDIKRKDIKRKDKVADEKATKQINDILDQVGKKLTPKLEIFPSRMSTMPPGL